MRRMRGIALCGGVTLALASALLAASLQPPDQSKPAARKGTKPAKNAQAQTPSSPPTSYVSLGVLSGTDADLLAQTLSSIFRGKFIVSACTDQSSNTDGGSAPETGSAGGQSSNSSKHTLKIDDWGQAKAPAKTKTSGQTPKSTECNLPESPQLPGCSKSEPGCAVQALVQSLDRDSFKGGVLSSAYVIPVSDAVLAGNLYSYFEHPASDLDIEKVASPADANTTLPYLVLVPTPLVQGQSATAKTLAQHAAELKQDLQRLDEYKAYRKNTAPHCLMDNPENAEKCREENTIVLQVLDPREVAVHAHDLFYNGTPPDYRAEMFPLNRAISFFPENQNSDPPALQARAIEQYELYKQNQAQQQLIATLQAAPTAAASTATPQPATTTTTTTIKTPVPSSTKGQTGGSVQQGAGAANQDSTQKSSSSTVTISTSTSTTPPASSSASSSAQSTGSASQNASQGGSGTQSSGSGSTGGGTGGTQAASAPAQPNAPSWDVDNIVRLYDYRDASGIANAINGMVSYVPSSRLIVQPLLDSGANDMIEILPSAAAQNGYSVGDIERAISLLDLPRPQLSLQVWSYQITAKVKNPSEAYKNPKRKCTGPCKSGAEDDDTRIALERIDQRVDVANRQMLWALESGMEAIFLEAKNAQPMPDCPHLTTAHLVSVSCAAKASDPFFDEQFREYLTMKYDACINLDKYCLGYFNALDLPSKDNRFVTNASLGRMLLFLAAANDLSAKKLVQQSTNITCPRSEELLSSALPNEIVTRMRCKLTEKDDPKCASCTLSGCNQKKRCDEYFPRPCKVGNRCYFSRFQNQLDRITDPGNLRIFRQAFLDFFFNFKWTLNYPHDFIPYDIRRSAHTLDDLLQPVVNAFNQDVDEYVQDAMDDPNLIPRDSKAGLISRGMVQVAALSGTPATVSGEVMNFFNITQTPPISQTLSNPPSGGIPGWNTSNPYSTAAASLAEILAAPKVEAQLNRGITLQVTPTSLDTADSAELNVNLLVNEPDGTPQSVNSATVTQDLLNRVAQHQVTDTVRVQNLKLFDLSTFSMEITHPKTPACLPFDNDDGKVKTFFYYATAPISVPCVVWRSVFGSVPVADRLFEWPRHPETVDNRSVAIIRAVVVPTAMDIGESLDFESDRVFDPITDITETLSYVGQLGWKPRQFHRLMMQCILNDSVPGCKNLTLSGIPDDIRKQTTN